MLRVKTVAERLCLSRNAVYSLIDKGEMPHYRIGGAIRVAEEQLKDFLASREVKREQGDRPREHKPPRTTLRHIRLS